MATDNKRQLLLASCKIEIANKKRFKAWLSSVIAVELLYTILLIILI